MIIKGGVNLYNMRNKFKVIYALIFFISIIIVGFTMEGKGSFDFNDNVVVNYEFKWNISNESNYRTAITHVVDEEMIENRYLFFRSNNKDVDIYIDEDEIYEYGDDAVLFLLREWTWHTVEIKPEYLGKEIKIVNNCGECLYGIDKINLSKSKTSILGYVVCNEMPSIIVSIVFVFISIILFVFSLLTRKIVKNNKMFYLSISAILVSIEFIINTNVFRLALTNYEVLNLVSCEIIMLIPMGIILHYLDDKDNRLPHVIEVLPILNFFAGNLLYLLGKFELVDVISLTKVVLIFEAVAFSINFIGNRFIRGEKDNKKATIAFIVMSMFIIFDLIRNCRVEYRYYFFLSKIGILLYVLSLVYDAFRETLDLFIEAKNAEVYKKLAYNDILTGVSNRLAFEKRIAEINENYSVCEKTLLIMIDINDLKYINDTQGHETGDKYIMNNINYISHKIDSLGDIYRTGGDEFVVIAPRNNRDILDDTFREMEKYISQNDKRINFAYGFAVFNDDIDHTIYDTLKRADKNMYRNKNKIKSKI